MIVDSLLKLRIAYKALWNNMLSEPSTKAFYAKVHEDVTSAMHNESVMNELFSTFKYMTEESKKPFINKNNPRDLLISMNADFATTAYTNKSKAISIQFKVTFMQVTNFSNTIFI